MTDGLKCSACKQMYDGNIYAVCPECGEEDSTWYCSDCREWWDNEMYIDCPECEDE